MTVEEDVAAIKETLAKNGNASERKAEQRPVGVLLSDVRPTRVRWLWQNRIPLGKLTVFDGDPGLGKSTITMDLAARVTRGLPMPDATPGVEGGVVVLTAEDALDDTVLPRLLVAGGDPRRVVALPVVGTGEDEHDPMLPDDLDAVEAAISRVGAVLVIVDPLMAYLPGSVNAHRDQDVRRALRRLATLAERTGAALLVVRHLNKGGLGNALSRGGGSIGIIGAARSGLLVAKDPEDPTVRVLAVTKTNLAPDDVPSLKYDRRSAEYPTEDGPGTAPRVDWLGTSTMTADGLLAALAEDGESKSMVEEVVEFLGDRLATGPAEAKKTKREAMDATGASERTVMTAKKKLGVRSRKWGMDGGWKWMLPDDLDAAVEDRGKLLVLPKDAAKKTNDAVPRELQPSRSSLHPSAPPEPLATHVRLVEEDPGQWRAVAKDGELRPCCRNLWAHGNLVDHLATHGLEVTP